ncbi:MAG: DUF423 domain-containing protein [Planctomycetaceae bacterium]|nr:DUF423 domain-containing protein [Planctomycetaceae bacterium]
MTRWLIFWSALSAAVAVAMGAFGAHALRDYLPTIHPAENVARMEANWETAARYQLIHAVGAIAATLALVQLRPHVPRVHFSQWLPVFCLLVGPLIFSGCLYAMVLGAPKILGAVVPIGGLLMIVGWTGLAVFCWPSKSR